MDVFPSQVSKALKLNNNLKKLHKNPGDSIILASLQNPVKIDGVISNYIPKVFNILQASSYSCDIRHKDVTAAGLYRNA